MVPFTLSLRSHGENESDHTCAPASFFATTHLASRIFLFALPLTVVENDDAETVSTSTRFSQLSYGCISQRALVPKTASSVHANALVAGSMAPAVTSNPTSPTREPSTSHPSSTRLVDSALAL